VLTKIFGTLISVFQVLSPMLGIGHLLAPAPCF